MSASVDAPSDVAVRAITEDGAFRVIAIRATETAQGAIDAQGATGPLAQRFGELIAGALLVRETMSPDHRVQCVLKQPGGGSLVADTYPGGDTRGLVSLEGEGASDIAWGQDALFQAIRVLHGGRLHQGVVAAPGGDVSATLMEYMQTSEQVTSMIAVGCIVEGSRVLAAGGYVVQLLPEVSEGPLMVMTERLEEFRDIAPLLRAHGADPEVLLTELLYGFPHEVLERAPMRFHCRCGPDRVVGALASLGREEIESIVAQGEVLEVDCDYCRTHYQVGPEQLRGLIETPS